MLIAIVDKLISEKATGLGSTDPSPAHAKKKKKESIGILLSVHAIMGFILLNFVVWRIRVPTASMEPTIRAGSTHLCWRLPYALGIADVSRGDVVIINRGDSSHLLMKRVIGLPGESVVIDNGFIIINGERIDEPYVREYASTYMNDYSSAEFKVPEGHVFVLGDNREHSLDSRRWDDPFISMEQIYARLLW